MMIWDQLSVNKYIWYMMMNKKKRKEKEKEKKDKMKCNKI